LIGSVFLIFAVFAAKGRLYNVANGSLKIRNSLCCPGEARRLKGS